MSVSYCHRRYGGAVPVGQMDTFGVWLAGGLCAMMRAACGEIARHAVL